MAFFNSSPFWDFYDAFDRDFFDPIDNAIRVSPRLLGSKSQQDSNQKDDFNKSVARRNPEQNRTSNNSLFKSLVNDSIFKPNFDIVPPLDLIEKEEKYELHASIPGVPRDQINVDFNDDNKELIISGNVPEINEENNVKGRHYKELRSGYFERRVRFGSDAAIDGEKIDAGYRNGILTITVPKVETKKDKENVRKIQIASHVDANAKL